MNTDTSEVFIFLTNFHYIEKHIFANIIVSEPNKVNEQLNLSLLKEVFWLYYCDLQLETTSWYCFIC